MKHIKMELMHFSSEGRNAEPCKDIFLRIYDGETIVFLGERNSGRYSLFDWICGKNSDYSGNVTVDTEQLPEDYLQENVYLLSSKMKSLVNENSAVCLSDYLFLMTMGCCDHFLIHQDIFQEKGKKLLEIVGLKRSLEEEVSNFTNLEILRGELAKAIHLNARIIAMENDLEGLNDEEILQFARLIRKLERDYRLSFIWNTNSLHGVGRIADRCMYFSNGTIIKKIDIVEEENVQLLKKLSEEDIRIFPMQQAKPINLNSTDEDLPFFRAEIQLHHIPLELSVKHGHIYSVVEYDMKAKRELFDQLTGKGSGKFYYYNQLLPSGWYFQKRKYPIIGLDALGIHGEFPNLSIKENILMLNYKKIAMPFAWIPKEAAGAVEKDWKRKHPHSLNNIHSMNRADRLSVQLESILIFHPELLICYEPFLHLDRQGKGLFAQLFSALIARNSSIVIITSSISNYLGEDNMLADTGFPSEILYEKGGKICHER